MYNFDLLTIKDFEITKESDKVFYNTDNIKSLKEWSNNSALKTSNLPQFSSALIVKQSGRGRMVEGSFGYLLSGGNNVGENSETVSLFSSSCSKGNGFSITIKNFFESVITFSVRRMIPKSWKNEKDEYLAPNEEHKQYEQYKYDCLVYSLFESKSNQSSLRQVEYKGQIWDIKNEFFWMSKDKMRELADEKGYDELYNDARTSPNRHVYNLLHGPDNIYDKLSSDAKSVLDKATELVERSLEMRQIMANNENHLNSWDAGYAQLKLVWKEYFPEDFKEFRQMYKNLEDRMSPLVYELGFLMK